MKNLLCRDCGLHIISADPTVRYCRCEIVSKGKRVKGPLRNRHIAREVMNLIMALAQRDSDREWAIKQ